MPIIHWFRRDLRLEDNTALAAAAASGNDIIPVFIFDNAILRHPDTGGPIVDFMLQCLVKLDGQLRQTGGRLLLLHGRPGDELQRLAKLSRASALYFNHDYAPDAVERDELVRTQLQQAGVAVHSFKDQVIFEEQEILTASSGEPFRVFTPYRNAWMKKLASMDQAAAGPPVRTCPKLRFATLSDGPSWRKLPTCAELGFTHSAQLTIPAGELAGRAMLDEFCHGPIHGYALNRNTPASPASASHLSPHLRHGTLSPRQCLRAALLAGQKGNGDAKSVTTWINQLIWRDFYQQLLFNFPDTAAQPFKSRWQKVAYRQDEEGWLKWRQGQTGFPIVDAAMRQLNSTGWMHNRLRMIVANFLTKDLLVDYHLGERYFMQRLIDGETAQNNGGWQWSAGCGADAQPYFRIFNPLRQSEMVDPNGQFIRQYLPQLREVPDELIHAPHLMSLDQQRQFGCRIGVDYPAPLVDHAQARLRALATFKMALGTPDPRAKS